MDAMLALTSAYHKNVKVQLRVRNYYFTEAQTAPEMAFNTKTRKTNRKDGLVSIINRTTHNICGTKIIRRRTIRDGLSHLFGKLKERFHSATLWLAAIWSYYVLKLTYSQFAFRILIFSCEYLRGELKCLPTLSKFELLSEWQKK